MGNKIILVTDTMYFSLCPPDNVSSNESSPDYFIAKR